MRFHFLTCLKNEVFSRFPRSTKRSKVCALAILFVDVYCICRRPFFENEVEEDPKMFMGNCRKVTSGIIANVSLSLKTYLKIIDWTGFAHTANLVLP